MTSSSAATLHEFDAYDRMPMSSQKFLPVNDSAEKLWRLISRLLDVLES